MRNHRFAWGVKTWHWYQEIDGGELWYGETQRIWIWEVPLAILAVEFRRWRSRRKWAKEAAAAAARSKAYRDEIPF